MKNTQYIETLFLVIFFAYGVALASGMILAQMLFKSLKEKYPAYYKSIGEPVGPVYVTFDTYFRAMKGANFGYVMVFRGIPKKFPKDKELRKLAQALRVSLTIVVVLFVMLATLVFFLYQSGVIHFSKRG